MQTLEGENLTVEDISHRLNIDYEQAQILDVAAEVLAALQTLESVCPRTKQTEGALGRAGRTIAATRGETIL